MHLNNRCANALLWIFILLPNVNNKFYSGDPQMRILTIMNYKIKLQSAYYFHTSAYKKTRIRLKNIVIRLRFCKLYPIVTKVDWEVIAGKWIRMRLIIQGQSQNQDQSLQHHQCCIFDGLLLHKRSIFLCEVCFI